MSQQAAAEVKWVLPDFVVHAAASHLPITAAFGCRCPFG